MTTQTQLHPAPLAKPGRILAGVVAPVLFVWCVIGFVVAVRPQLLGGLQTVWMLAGFEAINAFAAVILGMLAIGRFREAPAMTAGFAALAVAVGAGLGSVSSNHAIGTTDLIPYMQARLLLAAIIAIAALFFAIRSIPATLRLIIGASLVSPIVAGLGLFVLGRLGGILDPFEEMHPALALSIAIIAGFAALVAISAGGHLIFAAFEAEPASNTPAKKAAAKNAE